MTGFEPAASCSQSRRATNCATPGYSVFYPAGRILPNVACYQLHYTRIFGCHDYSTKIVRFKVFSCLWSFLWSKPLLCRFRQPGEIQKTQVSQGFAAFRLTLSRIPPRHSQSKRATNCATPRYGIHFASQIRF